MEREREIINNGMLLREIASAVVLKMPGMWDAFISNLKYAAKKVKQRNKCMSNWSWDVRVLRTDTTAMLSHLKQTPFLV